jgi:diguanylate cyclase (GGDEF)-like protein/PAS domain S-box-containing protein
MNDLKWRKKIQDLPGWLKVGAVAMVIIIAGLIWAVFSIYNNRKETELKHWTNLQLVVIREVARNSEAWYNLRVTKQKTDPLTVEKEIFDNFVTKIEVPGISDVWISYPDDVYLNRESPYFNGSIGKSLEDFFRLRAAAGGSHTDQVLAGTRAGSEGTDWYIVDPQIGKEIVSWTPAHLGGKTVTIGVSAPESKIFATSGVEEEFKRNLIFAAIMSSLLCVVCFLLWREEERIQIHASQLEKTIQEKTRELEYTNARYKTLVEQITAATYVDANDLECTPIFMSPQMEKFFGYNQQDWKDHPNLWMEMIHPDDRDRVMAEHIRTFETGDPFNMDYRVYTKAGRLMWVHDESVLAEDPKGMKTWHGVMFDISERKAMEEELRYLGHHDSLTGLYSRAFMETELNRLQNSREYPVSIIMSDLDKLKDVNDKFGHAVGDELLRRAASVIRSAFRSEDIIARMGGDEFAVILPSTDVKAAQAAIDRIHKAISRESRAGIDPKLKISLGSATAQQNESLEQALKRADRNMYTHKQANSFQKGEG